MQATLESFSPVAEVPHIVTLGTRGADCVSQVTALLHLRPSWKAQVGSLMLYCQDDLQEEAPSYWQRPWMQHIWAVDPEGRVHDPSLWNLEHWAATSQITLPSPIEEMQAVVIPFGPETMNEVNARVQAPFNENPTQVLAYFPGAIFGMPYDMQRPSDAWFQTWAGLAMVAAKEGGLTANQLEKALVVVDRKLSRQAKTAKPNAKGFG